MYTYIHICECVIAHKTFTSNVCVSGGGEASIWALGPPEAHLQQLPLWAGRQAEAGGVTAHQTANREDAEKIPSV